MMLHQWISPGSAALIALLVISVTSLNISTVEGFTTSQSKTTFHATLSQSYDRSVVIVHSTERSIDEKPIHDVFGVSILRHKATRIIAATIAAMAIVTSTPLDVWADGQTKDFKFPPIDYSDVNRCVLKGGSSMGQANAARDKLYDLRQCKLSGVDAMGYDLSGVSTLLLYLVYYLLYFVISILI
jgi:hypothetical protein